MRNYRRDGRHFFNMFPPPRFYALIYEIESSGSQPAHRKMFPRTFALILKIDFLKLRYPKGYTERLPLCRIIFSWFEQLA